jgi:NADH dehydrogenase (ubiquinone) 1 beta subcomplex subunit 9
MNKAFTEVCQLSRNHLGGELSHKQTVTRLYRSSLRLAFSWSIDRELFLGKAEDIRKQFDAVKGTPASGNVKAAVAHCQEELLAYAHPDPYVVPWMPGGSKFMRNPPPPPDVVHDGHAPADALHGTSTPVWPDMVSVEFRPRTKVSGYVVDFATKTMT